MSLKNYQKHKMIEINYLTKEDILTAHSIGFEQYGGNLHGYSEICIEKRVVEPQLFYFGVEQYPGIFKKASVYWHRLTTSHCFVDGNKRVGLLSTLMFLEMNGYEVIADDDSLYNYCLLIANHETRPSIEEVEDWLKQQTIKINN